MGEWAESMLDGTCCSVCGDYMGDGGGYAVTCAACERRDRPARVGLEGPWLRVATVLAGAGGAAPRAAIQDAVAGRFRNGRKRVNKTLTAMAGVGLLTQKDGDVWSLTKKGRQQLKVS